MDTTEMNRAREMALATALRIDDMIRRGIETRDNLVALFGLDGQIPSPAGAGGPELPPLADLDAEPELPVRIAADTPASAVRVAQHMADRKNAPRQAAGPKDDSEFGLLLEQFDKRGEPQKKLCRVLVNLPRTFKAEALAKELGQELKIAYQTADRLKQRGILERVGMGLYHRILPREQGAVTN